MVVEPQIGSVLGPTNIQSPMPIENFTEFKIWIHVMLPMHIISSIRTHSLASTKLLMGLMKKNTFINNIKNG